MTWSLHLGLSISHHDRVRLSDKVRSATTCLLDGADQRATGRRKSIVDLVYQITVGTDQASTTTNQVDGSFQTIIAVVAGLTHNHKIGVPIIHHEAMMIESRDQARFTENVGTTSGGKLALHEGGGGQSTRVDLLTIDSDTHTLQFALHFSGTTLTAVGQEEELFVVLLQKVHKLCGTGKQFILVVENTIHINEESILGTDRFQRLFLVHR
mmetsp:Transcript_42849/g.108175  ORF Transcript_42849/g.108175 Transcript_42849/m.108175 type:complete len:211 (-) Transcript_42849:298-930(-)